MSVIWHDLECGSYVEDLPLWRSLADEHGGPVLDVGAGTGRVALHLAGHGHAVTALDADPTLLAALAARHRELDIETVLADARSFAVPRRHPVCIVPMQTIQLLGGAGGRAAFLACARRAVAPGGVLAAAISEELECFEVRDGEAGPLPDIRELDGIVYCSRAVAIRARDGAFVLERVRETVGPRGERTLADDVVMLDRVSAAQLERECAEAGFEPLSRARIPATGEYTGSTVVIVRG
jgi:SAM-dependent methyltransferase